jgi:hypothetical protein
MIQNQYYYLVAGLPELLFEADNRKFDFLSIRDWLKKNLEGSDVNLFNSISLHYDNENVLSYIKDPSKVLNEKGTVSVDVYNDVKANVNLFPPYIKDFLNEFYKEKIEEDEEVETVEEVNEEEKSVKTVEVDFFTRYYAYLENIDNDFLHQWFNFDRQLRNILTATNARKLGKDVASCLIGSDTLNDVLSNSLASDFGLRGELPLMDKLIPAIEIENLFEREKKIDMIRWDFIDEVNTFNYFNLDKIFGYVLKAEIIDRWINLDPAAGEELLKKYFNDLKGTFDLDAAFDEQ